MSVEFEMSNLSSHTIGMTAGLYRSDEKPYGGIYVGVEKIRKKLSVSNIMKEREEKESSAKIEDGKPPKQNEAKNPIQLFALSMIFPCPMK